MNTDRTIRTNELSYNFLYTVTPGTYIALLVVEAHPDASAGEVRKSLTIENDMCWHTADNCGCVTRRDVLRLDRVSDTNKWNAVVESEARTAVE